MFDGIFETLHNELDKIDERLEGGSAISAQDLEHIDKMAHALKSLKTYVAMVEGCDDDSRRNRNRYRRY